MKFTWRGKQYLRNTGETTERAAEAKERKFRAGLESEHWETALAALESVKMRAESGDKMERLLAAWDPDWVTGEESGKPKGWKLVRQASAEKECRRCLNELINVLAYAKDLWIDVEQGRYRKKHTVQMPDRAAIGRLSMANVLCGETVRAYLRKRAEEECDCTVSWVERRPEHQRINAMVRNARDMLRDRVWTHVYEPAGLKRPARLNEFLTFDLLKEEEGEPEPLTVAEFEAMMRAATKLDASEDKLERELGLVNALMRQTGIRPGSIEAARGNWLENRHDGWWMVLRSVKSGTRKYEVPITDELAKRFEERITKLGADCFLILPTGTPAERAKIVDERHNAFMKGILGITGRGQGTYRLRDTAAAICRTWLSLDVAVELLGHEDEKTTRKHYARVRIGLSEIMKQELAAAQRLLPRNVVPMDATAKAA
jgi:integrase